MSSVASPTVAESALALSELARRELARRNLRDYIAQAWHIVEPAAIYQDSWHIAATAEHLEAVTRGEIRDLIINVPPRFMKSLAVDVFWPTWEWGPADMPHVRWLYNSYRQDLSVRDALKSRRLITSIWYQTRWGSRFQLSEDQNLKGRYDNDQGGYRIAMSVGGGNTGEGGDRIVADDPHNVREGESELNRNDVLTWWNEVMPSRRNDPKASSRVIIMQRVHEQDVIGDALEKGGYHLLRLPMEYDPKLSVDFSGFDWPCGTATKDPRTEDGELLWPERFGPDEVAKLKRDLGSYAYTAQYQQDPVPRAGAILDPGLFRPLPDDLSSKTGLTRIMFWDTAFSGRESADYTAAVTLDVELVNDSERMYLRAVYRDRLESAADPAHPERPARLAQAMADHIAALKPHLVGVEEAAFKQKAVADLIQQVRHLLRGRHTVDVRAIPVDRDKVTRARIVEGRLKAGDLYADRSASWWTSYAAELSAFPMRKEDDQVDATSGSVTMGIEFSHLKQHARELGAMAKTTLPIRRDRPGDGWGRLDPKYEGLFGR
jgi:predicted phage terminase large subunit-like protein